MKTLLVAVSVAVLSGCASNAKDIQPVYTSGMKYQNLSCEVLEREASMLSRKATTLAGEIDKNATGDDVAMGVGLVLFWPALFFIDGDGPETHQYASIKGDMIALEDSSMRQGCAISFRSNENEDRPADNSNNPVLGNDEQEYKQVSVNHSYTRANNTGIVKRFNPEFTTSADAQTKGYDPEVRGNYTKKMYDAEGNLMSEIKYSR